MTRRRSWILAGLAFVTVVLTAVLVPRPDAGDPLDPRSPGPGGTKALIETARLLGHDVSLTTLDGADTLVLFEDTLTEERRDDVRARVEAGARLVLTDPFSPLAGVRVIGQSATDPIGATARTPDCDWAALSDVGEVRSGRWLGLAPGDAIQDMAVDRCLPVGEGYALLRYPVSDGEVVVLGDAGALTNLRLGDAGNARLGLALLVRGPDDAVAVVPPPLPGEGEQTLRDLIPPRVGWAALVAVLVFLLVAWERGRRLGAPVDEDMPVRVPGSELVHAIGSMLQRSDAYEAAVRTIRRSAVADLATSVGLPADAPPELIVRRVCRGRALDEDALLALLSAPVQDTDGLLATQSALARIRATVRATAPTTADLADTDASSGDLL